jgi:hypothetical protein
MKKYLKTLLIIPCFLLLLPIVFLVVLRIPPEIFGCEGFGCIGVIFILPGLTVALTIPAAFLLYYMITKNSNFFKDLFITAKTFITKPFPKKKLILFISSIPTLLIILIIFTSIKTRIKIKHEDTINKIPTPTTSTSNITNSPIKENPQDWKTYTNEYFTFEYPESWRKEDIANYNPRYYGNGTIFYGCNTSIFSASVYDLTRPDSPYSDLDSYLKITGAPLASNATSGKGIKLDSYPAKYFESSGDPGSDNPKAKVILFSESKKIIVDLYFMNSCGESLDQIKYRFNQILSTFRFTNNPDLIATDSSQKESWTEYISSGGYSYSYPSAWTNFEYFRQSFVEMNPNQGYSNFSVTYDPVSSYDRKLSVIRKSSWSVVKEGNTTLNGYNCISLIGTVPADGIEYLRKYYLIIHRDYVYEVDLWEPVTNNQMTISNQILSTFKFTD